VFWGSVLPGEPVHFVDEQKVWFWLVLGLLPSLKPMMRKSTQIECHLRGVASLHDSQKLMYPNNPRTHPRGTLTMGLKKKLDRKHRELAICEDNDKGIGRLDSMILSLYI
jgi:hypothetical protein